MTASLVSELASLVLLVVFLVGIKSHKRLKCTNLGHTDKFTRCSAYVPQPVVALVDRLRMDCSAEVRSYVPSPLDQPAYLDHSGPFETFSRPPPMTHRG